MIVTIHQPNLFPWLGYFDKMMQADAFILLDQVPFTKGGFQNRVQLKGGNGPQWLTIPVATKGKLGQPTSEVECNDMLPWKRDHLKTFNANYRGTPYFNEIYPCLEYLYQNTKSAKLVDFTEPGIEWMRETMGIQTPMMKASELGASGSGSELLCQLVRSAGGSVYLSGPSGRDYLDERHFAEYGIRVDYHRFDMFPYPQRYGAFAGGLSGLDYLFHVKKPLERRGTA